MIGRSSFKVQPGKLDKIHKMGRKLNGDILNYQHKKIRENLQGLTIKNISRKPQLKHRLDWLKDDIESFHKLQKYYKRDGTTKIDKKMKNEIMLQEIEFFSRKSFEDFDGEIWDERFREHLNINKPCRNPLYFKNRIKNLYRSEN